MPERLALTALISFSLGILIFSVSRDFAFILPFLPVLGIIFALAWFFGKRDAYLYPALVFLLLALGGARAFLAPVDAPREFRDAFDTPVSLSGRVVADPDLREDSQRVTVAVQRGNRHMKLIAVVSRYTAVAYGDEVSVNGTLTRPEPFDTDGGREFAYDKFLAKDGIYGVIARATLTHEGEHHDVLTTTLRALLSGKHAFARALENALPEPHASLAEGLLVGGKQGLGTKLLDEFTVAGLLPIVVLSGYNVMIVAESLLVFLRFLPKRFALLVAAIAVAAFVFIGGAGSSALRVGLMAGIALFARSTGRRYAALRALLFVFVLMVLLSPLSLAYDPGFDFSFLATLGLILLSEPLSAHWMKLHPAWLREILATTVSAQLFVLPLLLYETGTLSFFAVPANLLVLPVVPFAMLFSAVAGLLALLLPPIAMIVGVPAYLLLSYIVNIARMIGELPFASLVVPVFPFPIVVMLYAGVAYLTYRIAKRAPAMTGARFATAA